MKCSNYLNRLNRLYKDSQIIKTEHALDSKRVSAIADSEVGGGSTSIQQVDTQGLLKNYGGEIMELTRVAGERAKNNALLNNKLIQQ